MKNLDPSWEQLLARLRGAGLRAGVDEAIKLHYLFELASTADHAERVRIARAVLVKSEEDGELFERVVEVWETSLAAASASAVTPESAEAVTRPGLSNTGSGARVAESNLRPLLPQRWALGAAALAIAVVAWVIVARLSPHNAGARPDAAVEVTEKISDAGTSTSTAQLDTRTFRAKVPVITVIGKQRDPRLVGAIAATIGLLTAIGLYFSIRRRALLPIVAKPKLRDGPERVSLAAPQLKSARLLDRRQQETVVWGIGRFVSDEPTAELDIDKTIDETARADGFPNLYYQFRRHPREVWIWVDESADQATALRLASDIANTLTQAGLPVERASFWGVPEVLLTADGRDFAPNEVDERRDTALVVIFTDGRILSRQTDAEQRWRRVSVLLRQLSLWPNLVFVDFSRGANNLEHYLAPFGVRVVEPEAMIAFMGGLNEAAAAQQAVFAPSLTGDVRAWAAACALAPSPIDEGTAFSVREALGLAASPWGIESVRASAESAGELFAWRGAARAELLRWLRDAAPEVLSRALALWIDRYRDDDSARIGADAIEPWIDTPAQRFLHMERALLDLWTTPETAAIELYRLHQAGDAALVAALRAHLAQLSALDLGEPSDTIALPWRMDNLAPRTRAMLAGVGFASAAGFELRSKLVRPARQWLGVGLAAGAALAGAFWLARPHEQAGVQVTGDASRCDVSGGSIHCWTPFTYQALDVALDSKVMIEEREQELRCREEIDDVVYFRCGRAQLPAVPPLRWKGGSRFTIRRTTGFETFAIKLIETGNATLVDAAGELTSPPPVSFEQWIDLTSATRPLDNARAAAALDFVGERTFDEVFGEVPLRSDVSTVIGSGTPQQTSRDAGTGDAEPAAAPDGGRTPEAGIPDATVAPPQPLTLRITGVPDRVLIQRATDEREESKVTLTLDNRPLRTRTPTVAAGPHDLAVTGAAGVLATKSVALEATSQTIDFNLDIQPPKSGFIAGFIAQIRQKDGRLSARMMPGEVHLRDPGTYELYLIGHGTMRVELFAGTLTHIVPRANNKNALTIINFPNDTEVLIDGQSVLVQEGLVPIPYGKKFVALTLHHPDYYDLYRRIQIEVVDPDTDTTKIELQPPQRDCKWWLSAKWEERAADLTKAGFKAYEKNSVAPNDRLFVQPPPGRGTRITWRLQSTPFAARKQIESERLGPFEDFVPLLGELRGYNFDGGKSSTANEKIIIESGQRQICTLDPSPAAEQPNH